VVRQGPIGRCGASPGACVLSSDMAESTTHSSGHLVWIDCEM